MEYFYEQRAAGTEGATIKENIQRWYLADKEQTIQKEFEELLREWTSVSEPQAVARGSNI